MVLKVHGLELIKGRDSMKEVLVFVYGTLKKGYGNNFYLNNSTFLGTGTVKGELYKSGHLPYLVEGKDDIKGEAYIVPIEDYAYIRSLELGAGYYEDVTEVNIGGKVLEGITFKYNKKTIYDYKNKTRIKEYTYNIYNTWDEGLDKA
jgi:gamma-glutamylcyclotransferase (GGCT)/AIG2-like uncharacterized protein YtfP